MDCRCLNCDQMLINPDELFCDNNCSIEHEKALFEELKEGNYMQEQSLIETSPVKVNNLTDMSKEIFDSNYRVGWWNQQDLDSLIRPRASAVLKIEECSKYSKEGSMLIAMKLALVHSEISEALEGMRKGLMDDHLKDEEQFGVELADTIIRILDLAGACQIDIGRLVTKKIEYNSQRADHKMENRLAAGGKTI